jgi:hypothetical protein
MDEELRLRRSLLAPACYRCCTVSTGGRFPHAARPDSKCKWVIRRRRARSMRGTEVTGCSQEGRPYQGQLSGVQAGDPDLCCNTTLSGWQVSSFSICGRALTRF